jgi:hypothetical protein
MLVLLVLLDYDGYASTLLHEVVVAVIRFPLPVPMVIRNRRLSSYSLFDFFNHHQDEVLRRTAKHSYYSRVLRKHRREKYCPVCIRPRWRCHVSLHEKLTLFMNEERFLRRVERDASICLVQADKRQESQKIGLSGPN